MMLYALSLKPFWISESPSCSVVDNCLVSFFWTKCGNVQIHPGLFLKNFQIACKIVTNPGGWEWGGRGYVKGFDIEHFSSIFYRF